MSINVNESKLPSELKLRMAEHWNMFWQENKTEDFYKSLFSAISMYLRMKAKKEKQVVLKLIDMKGNFMMASILDYHEPEDQDDPDAKGSWSIQYTLDESDISKNAEVSDSHNNEFIQFFEKEHLRIARGQFKSNDLIHSCISESVDTLIDFMKANAPSDGSEFELECDGYFVATSQINGENCDIAIVAGAEAKKAIKNDVAA